jgi:DNA-binding winged helix-turn-helix (wHTH) protein
MDYWLVSHGKLAVGTQLLSRPNPQADPDAGPALSWAEQVPPPGRDATLLAVVPIPGTGTSLAIVGYAIATSGTVSSATSGIASSVASGIASSVTSGTSVSATAGGLEPTATTKESGLLLDSAQRRVWAGGDEITLAFQEFELLAFLSAHPATVFSRAELVEQVWHRNLAHGGVDVGRESRTVDVHISRVRHKLGPHYGQCLVTEYRVGYQFRPLPA